MAGKYENYLGWFQAKANLDGYLKKKFIKLFFR